MDEEATEELPGGGSTPYVPSRITGPVLAGVVPGQSPALLQRAADLAYTLNVKLICAYVDITTYLTEEPDEGIEAPLLGPEGPADDAEGAGAGIRERLQNILEGTGIRWSFLILSGNPARALGLLAETAAASVIVVGTRAPRLGTRLEHLLVGSVAVQLTHRQPRPVLVVPLPNATPRYGEDH
jgi:nucleotide-binding universal stress UspA family protein